jgi:hypothetical protein
MIWVNTATRTGSSLPLSSSTCDRRCPQRLRYSSPTLARRHDAESGSKTCGLGSTGARRVGKFVHAISSVNLRLREMGIKLLSRPCAWRMQIHLMVWLDGLVYCMLFSKHLLTGIYRLVEHSDQCASMTTGRLVHWGTHSRASRQFSRAQRTSEVPQRHRRFHHEGSAYQGGENPIAVRMWRVASCIGVY